MNTVTVLASVAIIFTSTYSSANEFVANDNSAATQLCMAVASNHKLTLRKEIREHNISKAVLNNRLACNEMPITAFASRYNLTKSAQFLNINTSTSTHIKDLSAMTKDTSAPVMLSGSK